MSEQRCDFGISAPGAGLHSDQLDEGIYIRAPMLQ